MPIARPSCRCPHTKWDCRTFRTNKRFDTNISRLANELALGVHSIVRIFDKLHGLALARRIENPNAQVVKRGRRRPSCRAVGNFGGSEHKPSKRVESHDRDCTLTRTIRVFALAASTPLRTGISPLLLQRCSHVSPWPLVDSRTIPDPGPAMPARPRAT